jgi:hypothetical protein
MNAHVILRWDWEVESKVDADFTIIGIFSDIEEAQFHLDTLQRNALLRQVTGSFYWIETHEVNKILTGEHSD